MRGRVTISSLPDSPRSPILCVISREMLCCKDDCSMVMSRFFLSARARSFMALTPSVQTAFRVGLLYSQRPEIVSSSESLAIILNELSFLVKDVGSGLCIANLVDYLQTLSSSLCAQFYVCPGPVKSGHSLDRHDTSDSTSSRNDVALVSIWAMKACSFAGNKLKSIRSVMITAFSKFVLENLMFIY